LNLHPRGVNARCNFRHPYSFEQFICELCARINRAAYVPTLDFIVLPPESAFRTREHFLATSLHELGHWTGAKPRLDRDLKSRFNEKAYAAEELIAELTAAFLCAHLGIKGELRHAEYIASWISLLKDDNRAIFTASSKASQAADYLRTFSET
jgi:antirestriction protein ArdC